MEGIIDATVTVQIAFMPGVGLVSEPPELKYGFPALLPCAKHPCVYPAKVALTIGCPAPNPRASNAAEHAVGEVTIFAVYSGQLAVNE